MPKLFGHRSSLVYLLVAQNLNNETSKASQNSPAVKIQPKFLASRADKSNKIEHIVFLPDKLRRGSCKMDAIEENSQR